MSAQQQEPGRYALREGVRVFRSGEGIRFRKGVWSFSEAAVRLDGQGERVVAFFDALFQELVQGREVDAAELARTAGLGSEERGSCLEVLEGLKRQQFLGAGGRADATRVVSALLGGNLSGFEEYVGAVRPVLFFADSQPAAAAARTMAGEIGLPLDVLEPDTAQALARADLTTRTDAIAHVEALTALERHFSDYACVLGCIAAPNLAMLRNLNRVLVRLEKPLVLGLIDGPFMSVLSTLATETGCFECYEQRMLARLEDTQVYQRFVEASAGATPQNGQIGACFSPPLHMLTSAVVSEGFLYSTLGMLRLAGRIVNVYLPLLEIQVQDLLRVPYCPACGFISKAQMNEMYTSSRRLVNEMLAKVELGS